QDKGAAYHCNLYDADIVHKIAQELLPGLASACVDNTTGGIFRSPASVAVDIRREMVDYLVTRSETFVAESMVLDDDPASDDPYDIISDFVDDFATSKRNFFSKVSAWVLSERREDRIDDFVQEMEMSGFWLLNRRESVVRTLLKNVDFKGSYHCNMKFNHPEEAEQHSLSCYFRAVTCSNEGCNATFSAGQGENHDSNCPFKILRCEQNCQDLIMRREMDRHCITVCPMKLVKCPFYSVGCTASVPNCRIDEHRLDALTTHLVHVLQLLHKEASSQDLNHRADEVIKLSSPTKLASASDARSLTYMVKEIEANLGPFELKVKPAAADDA
ncbi:hypothetical protein M569_00527, partial [Genlisea aurea]